MLTLVLSCDEPGCDARHEITSDTAPNAMDVEAASWRWGQPRGSLLPLWCPEHAGAAA